MNRCEQYETLVSTWIDGELDREGQIECLDHLVRCEACREFYVDARALDGLLAGVRTPAGAGPLPTEVSRHIENVARRGDAGARRGPVPLRLLQAAAVVLVGLGLSITVWSGRFGPPEPAEVLLGEGRDMTEARFVELTKEVLQAEPRYRSEMVRVLEQVSRTASGRPEASDESRLGSPDEERSVERPEERAFRIPV